MDAAPSGRPPILAGSLPLDLVELGDPFDDAAHVRPEPLLDFRHRNVAVLDRVVEQRPGNRRAVQAQIGQDRGDGERMLDVGTAGAAELAPVGLVGEPVGVLHQGYLVSRKVTVRLTQEIGYARRHLARPPPDFNSISGEV